MRVVVGGDGVDLLVRCSQNIGVEIRVNSLESLRLDQFLVPHFPELSRSRIQTLIKQGCIRLNGEEVKPKQGLSLGDLISVFLPKDEVPVALPEDISLDVLYEDEHIIVVNKAHGMVTHPAAGNADGTLVNALLFHCDQGLSSKGGDLRPGIVHRLDKDTSGCLIEAKSDLAYDSLTKQFSSRSCKKHYLAVLDKTPLKENDSIFTHIGRHPTNRLKMAVVNPGSGKAAITDYEILGSREDGTCLALCDLKTGRTHQIRVHMRHIGAPIIGDPIYAKPSRQIVQTGRLMLHAWRLSIDHPETLERLHFEAPIPREYEPWMGVKTDVFSE